MLGTVLIVCVFRSSRSPGPSTCSVVRTGVGALGTWDCPQSTAPFSVSSVWVLGGAHPERPGQRRHGAPAGLLCQPTRHSLADAWAGTIEDFLPKCPSLPLSPSLPLPPLPFPSSPSPPPHLIILHENIWRINFLVFWNLCVTWFNIVLMT